MRLNKASWIFPAALALCLAAACALPARAADWPMFRGGLTHTAATAESV